MRRQIQVDAPVGRSELADVMANLETYPHWLDVVQSVEPAPATPADTGPAWFITLRAQVGRFARSKRLRVVRTAADGEHVRFERGEDDDRQHSAWTMDARLSGDDARSVADLTLAYDGGLWSTVLDAVLGDQIGSGTERLRAYLLSRSSS